jgi:hypothetical protein
VNVVPTPFESASLNLQLFELRREPALREARAWFVRDFNPASLAELVAIVRGPRNAAFRMVLGYWDMAASFVTTGAIEAGAFLAAHGEIFATFGKIQPLLAELRAGTGEPEFCKHLEAVVLGAPDGQAIVNRRLAALRAAATGRPKAPLFAVMEVRGPAWLEDRPLEGQPEWDAHAAFMDALVADGFVLLGGPLEGTSNVLLIVRAADEREIYQRLSGDPWRMRDLLRTVRITPWTLRLGSLG